VQAGEQPFPVTAVALVLPLSVGRTGRSRDRAIEPPRCLLESREGFFRLVFEEKYQSRSRLFAGAGFAVRLETVPVHRGDGQPLGEFPSEF
jgi:hypothetical protein